MGKLIILAGPSCVGKSPLDKALKRFHPDLRNAWTSLVLYNSRAPRPGEEDGRDYHFRSRSTIEDLKGENRYVVMDVRGDLQALDIDQLEEDLRSGDVFFEGNPFVGKVLVTHEKLQQVEKRSLFMSPLALEELRFLKQEAGEEALRSLVTDIMRRKLLRRTTKQKGILSLKDLENIETRAGSAFGELQMAPLFDWVIANHDGEDSEHWDTFYYPVGDARKAALAFVEIIRESSSEMAEQWPDDAF
jgi:guanylate kinase